MAGVGSIGSVTPMTDQIVSLSQRANRQPAPDRSVSRSDGIIDVGDLPGGIIDVGDLPDGVSESTFDRARLSTANGAGNPTTNLTDTERAYLSDSLTDTERGYLSGARQFVDERV